MPTVSPTASLAPLVAMTTSAFGFCVKTTPLTLRSSAAVSPTAAPGAGVTEGAAGLA